MAEFSTDIHPKFAGIPDIQLAQAASELVFRLGDFKVVGKPSALEFPPEPAELDAMQLAYIEEGTSGARVRRQFLAFGDRKRTSQDFPRAYARDMKIVDQDVPRRTELTPADKELLAIAPGLSRQAGLRTVASFALFRSARNEKRVYSGLLVPGITVEQGPLAFRHMYVSLMGEVGGKEKLKELQRQQGDTEEGIVDDIIGVQNAAIHAGAFLAGIHLPSIERVAEITRHQSTPAQHLGPNREQRRALKKLF
jgi:hypothetical protein